MADQVRKVTYCYAKVARRAGQGARMLAALRTAGVNLTAFSGFPDGKGRAQIDFANLTSIADAIAAARPDAIINAAGYTGVDRAETETDLAFRLNRDAAGLVAQAAARAGAALVHLSTDYVFDGSNASPYLESDERNPINVYGRSKAEGELVVAWYDSGTIY